MQLLVSVSNNRLSYNSLSATVANVVNNYLKYDQLARSAQLSAEQAQLAYPRLLKNILKELEAEDVIGKLIEYKGYRHNLDDTMTEAFKDKVPSQISHAVIQIGNMAIDPCRARMGKHYGLPLSYDMRLAHGYWAALMDRTHLAKMTPEEARALLQQQKLKKTGATVDSDLDKDDAQ